MNQLSTSAAAAFVRAAGAAASLATGCRSLSVHLENSFQQRLSPSPTPAFAAQPFRVRCRTSRRCCSPTRALTAAVVQIMCAHMQAAAAVLFGGGSGGSTALPDPNLSDRRLSVISIVAKRRKVYFSGSSLNKHRC